MQQEWEVRGCPAMDARQDLQKGARGQGEGRQASVGFRGVATCGWALGTRLGARLSEALDGARRGPPQEMCVKGAPDRVMPGGECGRNVLTFQSPHGRA